MTYKELSHSLKESLSSSSIRAITVIEQYEEEYPHLSEQAEITLKVKDLKKALQVAQRDWPYVVANRRARQHNEKPSSKPDVELCSLRHSIAERIDSSNSLPTGSKGCGRNSSHRPYHHAGGR